MKTSSYLKIGAAIVCLLAGVQAKLARRSSTFRVAI